MYKVALINVQTLHACCGYGYGETREEAVADALRVAKERDKDAYYCEQCGAVCFAGGVSC